MQRDCVEISVMPNDFTEKIKTNLQEHHSFPSHSASYISYIFKIPKRICWLVGVSNSLPTRLLGRALFTLFSSLPRPWFIAQRLLEHLPDPLFSVSIPLSPQLVWAQPLLQITAGFPCRRSHFQRLNQPPVRDSQEKMLHWCWLYIKNYLCAIKFPMYSLRSSCQ